MHTKRSNNLNSHAAFRKTSQWRQFRQRMKSKHKVDYVTGSPLTPTFNLHHLNPYEYENLGEELFVCLNFQTHDFLHFLFGYENGRRDWRARLKKLEELCELMEQYSDAHGDPYKYKD